MTTKHTMLDEAAGWAARTGDPHFADWDGFTAWLEADPDHAQAYDRVMAAVADAADLVARHPEAHAPLPANDAAPVRGPTRRGWLGGAVAASLAVIALVSVLRSDQGTEYVTAPGETRSFALSDGSRITLAGGTSLTVKDERLAVLGRGQALFEIRHDPARRFEVRAGDDRLVDLGTVFDVKRQGGTTVLGVAEGAVVFNPDRQKIEVRPGQQAIRRDGSDRIARSGVPAADIGEWRAGRITFRGATLAEIAADLSRSTGLAFAAGGGTADRQVSGSVLLAPLRSDPASLGPLLGVTVKAQGNGWIIEP